MSRGVASGASGSRKSLYTAGILAAAFVFMSVLASRGVGRWEQDSFNVIYDAPESWRLAVLIVTQLGSAWFWLALVALLFIIRRRPGSGLTMLRNGTFAYMAVAIAKFVVDRPRPELLLSDVVPREHITVGLGFPSAHVTIATVMALTLLPFFKGIWRWIVPLGWISAVAWSRLYLGVHAPLDVLGGLVLGILVVMIVAHFPQKGAWKR